MFYISIPIIIAISINPILGYNSFASSFYNKRDTKNDPKGFGFSNINNLNNRDNQGSIISFPSQNGIRRQARYGVVDRIENGKVYSIQNEKDKWYLTAKSGPNNPSPVVVNKWQNKPSQLWEVTQLGNRGNSGFSLKPLNNEFNSVTSQLYVASDTSASHTYIPWKFDKKGNRKDSPWIVHYIEGDKKFCLTSNGFLRSVSAKACNPYDKGQLWEFRDEDDNEI